MKIAALIPMRKGSRRLPGKHLRMLDGISPAMRAVNAALSAPAIDQVFVSTNDTDIVEHLKRKAVSFISQPTASDHSRTEQAVKTFIETIDSDLIILIQATNPFHKAFHLQRGIALMSERKADCVLSGVWVNRYFYEKKGIDHIIPIDRNCKDRPGLAHVEQRFIENGAFYIFRPCDFMRSGKLLNGKIAAYGMSFESLIELDEQADWELAESIISNRIR